MVLAWQLPILLVKIPGHIEKGFPVASKNIIYDDELLNKRMGL
jgi:hypothetical protein